MMPSARARARLERLAAHLRPLSSTSSPPDEPPAPSRPRPLADAFSGVEGASTTTATAADLAARWDGVWRAGVAPGQKGCFDAGGAAPALLDLLSSSDINHNPFAGRRRVLVPGCGRGYELLPLAAAAATTEVVGLESSEAAASAAEEYLAASDAPDGVKQRVRIERGDFFAYDAKVSPRLSVGAAFDHTFLCTFPPGALRVAWAEAYARLLEPRAELVVLLFPVDNDDENGSTKRRRLAPPPWPVSPAETSALLAPFFERVSLSPVPPNLSHPSRAGREWLGRWRRREE
jgi:hypothetical protein